MLTKRWPEPKRQAIFLATAEALVDVCKPNRMMTRKCKVVKNALPDDAEILRMGHDQTGRLCIVLTSETFAVVAEGEELPILPDPVFETVYDEEAVLADALKGAPVEKAVH